MNGGERRGFVLAIDHQRDVDLGRALGDRPHVDVAISEDSKQLAGDAVAQALALGDFKGQPGETALLPGSGKARRLLLQCIGKK